MLTVFKLKTKRRHALTYEISEDSIHFTLKESGNPLPVNQWESTGHQGGLALLQHFQDTGAFVDMTANTLSFTHEAFMQWCDEQERYIQCLLDLPPLYDGSIRIESNGTFHMPDFAISYTWQKPNGQCYTSAQEQGCFLTVAGTTYLLSPHAWKLKQALQALQLRLKDRTETTQRMIDWHEVQQLLEALPEEERQKTLQTSSLQSIRLYYANALRLEALPVADGSYDITPVLMRQKISVSDTEDSPPTHELLLTPAMQQQYAKHYAGANSLSRCHSLDTGRYIIIGEDVHRILTHIQEVRKRSPEERLEFLKNPRAALMCELEHVFSEEMFTSILSDRITGLGVWQEKAIPFINLKGQRWLPDGKLPEGAEKGIKIGDKILFIRSETEARDILIACDQAMREEVSHFIYDGEAFPATSDVSQAVQTHLPPARPIHKSSTKDISYEECATISPFVVIVKENFDELLYEVQTIPRASVPSYDFVPEQVKSTLKPHQEDGFNWLCRHYRAGSRGALLADDMGLGKTFQALVFLAWLKQGMDDKNIDKMPLLIIAPTGLLDNWKKEINLHLKDGLGECVDAYGNTLKQYRTDNVLKTQQLQDADLILTTYETLNKYQTSFAVVRFAAVIFDEMQNVKNPASQKTNAVNSIHADFWLGMTGTPVENRLCDLWCITDILQPGWMGSVKQFSQHYEKPLTQDPVCYNNLEILRQRITEDSSHSPAYMLRRMKDEVLEMPPKIIHTWQEPMPSQQAEAYSEAIHKAQIEERKGGMLQTLQRMRAISLHPDYMRTSLNDDNTFIKGSARLKKCFEILENIRHNKEKALVFVEYDHWHSFLPDMIARYFSITRPLSINGAVKGQERQKRVEEFQNKADGFDLMLISPKAGGVGLTLTAANHVIHLTRWWNPAVEDQATDRVYRIGQEKEVHVHYPMAVHPEMRDNSYDLILHSLLEKKRELSRKSLVPMINEEADRATLYDAAIWQSKNKKMDQQGVNSLTGQEFQQFVTTRLQQFAGQYGLAVRSAVGSWDGGADIIIETLSGELIGIIQCKHSGNPNVTTTASHDIRRAFKNYGLKDGFGIAISNARASEADIQWQAENPDNHIILQQKQALHPEKILSLIADKILIY